MLSPSTFLLLLGWSGIPDTGYCRAAQPLEDLHKSLKGSEGLWRALRALEEYGGWLPNMALGVHFPRPSFRAFVSPAPFPLSPGSPHFPWPWKLMRPQKLCPPPLQGKGQANTTAACASGRRAARSLFRVGSGVTIGVTKEQRRCSTSAEPALRSLGERQPHPVHGTYQPSPSPQPDRTARLSPWLCR